MSHLLCKTIASRFALGMPAIRGVVSAAQSPLAELRKKTGYAYHMCKKALDENKGDMEKARVWLEAEALRSGLQKACNLEGRKTGHGLIGVLCQSNRALIVEVNCETDFVAKNDAFKQLVSNMTQAIFLKSAPVPSQESIQKVDLDIDKLKAPLEDLTGRAVTQLGENVKLCRAIETSLNPQHGHLFAYIHSIGSQVASPVLIGKSCAVVALKDKGQIDQDTLPTIGKQLCQHIIGLDPKSLGQLELQFTHETASDASENETEKSAVEMSREKSKDAEYEDSDAELDEDIFDTDTLYDQALLFNPKMTVRDFAVNNGFEVIDFYRYECGKI